MGQKFRFHILPPAHTVTNHEYTSCAYTSKVLKFGKMMVQRGHEVIHYGHEDSNLVCTEHVTVTTNRDLKIAYGNFDWRKNFFKFDMNDHVYQTQYKNTIREVGKRKQPLDFLLPFWGRGNFPVCTAHPDMIIVEPGIGYGDGHFAKFRIYESYAIRSAVGGPNSVMKCTEDWYHAVIPNYFDPNDFEYSKEKDDYFLFLGRVYGGKGIDIAYQVCDKLGVKLIVAGQGSLTESGYKETDNIKHVGYANAEKRKQLMSRAKGFFLPSMFSEPFGGAAVEALFSGTPVITTDWGVFPEYVLPGITGYRCRTFSEFLWAAKNIDKINPQDCRDWAMNNYSLDRIGRMYEHFFKMCHNIYLDAGWYAEDDHEDGLEWLNRYYPQGTMKLIPPI